jgi:hypothetical protein
VDLGGELDAVAQGEMVDEGVEVVRDLHVVRVCRVLVGHRE